MRKLTAYIAMSLDGKIAGPNDDLAWLDAVPNPEKSDYGYEDFYKSVDTTIMGGASWRLIDQMDVPFPYGRTKNYVLTRDTQLKDTDDVTFVSGNVSVFLKELKEAEGGDIWLIGGGQVNGLCLNLGLIDELRIFVMPVILGEGAPLFAGNVHSQALRLIRSTTHSSGVCELRYRINNT